MAPAFKGRREYLLEAVTQNINNKIIAVKIIFYSKRKKLILVFYA